MHSVVYYYCIHVYTPCSIVSDAVILVQSIRYSTVDDNDGDKS